MTKEEHEKKADLFLHDLHEQGWDCVQILMSKTTHEGTVSLFRGAGNWYARQGMAAEFMERDRADTLSKEIRHATQDEE